MLVFNRQPESLLMLFLQNWAQDFAVGFFISFLVSFCIFQVHGGYFDLFDGFLLVQIFLIFEARF